MGTLLLPAVVLAGSLSILIILLVVLSSSREESTSALRSGELHLMEEGKVEGESSSRAGRWIKEIFKKKEGELAEENDASDDTPVANGHKTTELADIREEDEEEKLNTELKTNGNGNASREVEEEEHEEDKDMRDYEKQEDELEDTKEANQNAANEKLEKDAEEKQELEKEDEGKDSEARMQESLVTYVAKEKEVENEKSINGVMRVFGRFMKRINSEPDEGETGQPPSYSEAVQDTSEAEQQAANLAVNDDVPEKETLEEEDALPESERAPDVEEKDEEQEEELSKEATPDEPEPKFRFRFQRFFSDN